MANVLDYFKMWQDSPHTADLQGLLDPNPDYAQQYLYPMSPNNPFGLQERSMGLLGGMQQASNQAVMPQSPPTQYVEPGPTQAGPAPAADPFMVYKGLDDRDRHDMRDYMPYYQAMFDPSQQGGGISQNDWQANWAAVPQDAVRYENLMQHQRMGGLLGQ